MGLFECFLDWTMVGVVFLLLSYAWGVFVFLVCMPLIQAGYPLLWPISYLVIGHILFILVIWSYLRAVFTRTYVPSSFTHEVRVPMSPHKRDRHQCPFLLALPSPGIVFSHRVVEQ